MPKSDWTKAECKTWLKAHDFYTDGLDETEKTYRWRQVDPESDKFIYRTEETSSDGKPIKFVYAAPKPKARSVTFRGRVMAVDVVGDGSVATVGVRSGAGTVTVLDPVVAADCAGHSVSTGDVVLVRCEWEAEAVRAEVVAVAIIDAVPDTAEEFRAAVKSETARFERMTRSAPIVDKRIVRDMEGKDRQLLTCVVYEPGRIDVSWGTTASPEMVEAWAHGFMISSIALRGETITDEHWQRDASGAWVLRDPELGDVTEHGVPTNRVPADPIDAYVVESWVKRCDCPIGSVPVAKGSWLIEVWIRDPEKWQCVLAGEYVGVSIEGWKAKP
jgi:hypothetical protein